MAALRVKGAIEGAKSFLEFLDDTLGVGAKLTPAQRVWTRVALDDVDPIDLETEEEQALAAEMFDFYDPEDPAHDRHLERVTPAARGVVAMLKGARAGGTWICALYLLYRAIVADLSALADGEVAFAPIVAPDMDTAGQALRFAAGAARAVPSLNELIESSTSEALRLRRRDGHEVEIVVRAASRGGKATRGRSYVAGLLDESAFFLDRDTGVVNDEEVFRSVDVRVITGGKTCVISTAWLESGLLHELVEHNLGSPRTALASVTPTELMREGDEEVAQRVANARERDPENAAREFDCVAFTGGSDVMFPLALLTACHDAPAVPVGTMSAGGDFGFRRDSAAIATVRSANSRHELDQLDEVRPQKGSPLKPSKVVGRFAKLVKRCGAKSLATDLAYVESIREHLDEAGLTLTELPSGQAGKADVHMVTKTAMREGRLRLSRPAEVTDTEQKRHLQTLLAQLGKIVQRPVPGGGLVISIPRDKTGHGDIASAFLAAVWFAERMTGQTASTSSGTREGAQFSSGPRAGELIQVEVVDGVGVRVGAPGARTSSRRDGNPGYSGGF